MIDSRAERVASNVVLIVEDEPLLLLMALDFVEEAGFRALAAANSAEAIAVMQRRSDVTIVFTDIDMPGGIDGLKLAALVRDRWPPVEIIITSGYRHPPPGELPVRGVFFPKPYQPSKIVAALNRMAA